MCCRSGDVIAPTFGTVTKAPHKLRKKNVWEDHQLLIRRNPSQTHIVYYKQQELPLRLKMEQRESPSKFRGEHGALAPAVRVRDPSPRSHLMNRSAQSNPACSPSPLFLAEQP